MGRFKFINFCPREDVEFYANQALSRLLDRMPSDSIVKASAKQQGLDFYFSISVRSASKTFEINRLLTAGLSERNQRLWQKQVIDEILKELHEKILEWKKTVEL